MISQLVGKSSFFQFAHAPVQLNNPAIISVPLSFLTLVIVSLITQKTKARNGEQENIPAEEAEEIAK